MATNRNTDVTVNVYGTAQRVDRTVFGDVLICSSDVSFGELYKSYTDPTTAAADSELGTTAKAAVAVFFAQDKKPTTVYVADVDPTQYSTDLTALQLENDSWYHVVPTDQSVTKDDNAADLAAWGSGKRKMIWVDTDSPAVASGTGLISDLAANNYDNTIASYHHDSTEYPSIAWAASFGSANPDSESTVAGKRTLSGVTVQGAAFTGTHKANVEADNGNVYVGFYGISTTGPGKVVDGTWADVIITEHWFASRVEERVAQSMVDAVALNSKIPFTNTGIALIEGDIVAIYLQGVKAGHFAPDSLVVNKPDISEVSDADISARSLTMQATCTLAGAIDTVTLNIGILAS